MEAKELEKGESKQRRPRRDVPAKEKCKAVLAIWTERRKASELCRELGVNRIQVLRWEEQALEGMLQSLELKTRKAGPELKALSRHLERLLEKSLPKRLAKLEERLGRMQEQEIQEKQITE